MKKIVCLLIVFTLMGCVGCGAKESSQNTSNEVVLSPTDIPDDDIDDLTEEIADEETLPPADAPCDEILNASLAAGFIQIDNFLFKVDGTYTMADVMNVVNKNDKEYVFYDDFDKFLSLDDYAGDTDTLGVRTPESKYDSYFSVQIANDFEEQTTPTYGESIIECFSVYDSYYCLANGFTSGYDISEDDLQAYFQKEGLTEGTVSWTQKKNTYIRREDDGIPFYNAYVVSESNPDVILFYQFVYKSKNTLGSCSIRLNHASSYAD